jgi:diguanylate cyclase (GGDEF)-like protein/PAS domain S-box-containing protein
VSASALTRDKVEAPPDGLGRPALDHVGSRLGGLFRSLSMTILLAVGIAAGCGLGALWMLYDIEQGALLKEDHERTMRKLSETVIRGLEAVMLQGSAESVYRYFESVQSVRGIAALRVLRTDGTEAFHNNRTIDLVNARLGTPAFKPTARAHVAPFSLASPYLQRALKEADAVSYYETGAQGAHLMTVLHPLANAEACHGCHGGDHTLRGVVMVTTSLDATDRAVRGLRHKTLAVLAAALAGIVVLTYALIRLVVVRRVRTVSDAMHTIVLGDYSTRVPDSSRDELGDMARSFNRMAENLLASSSRLNEKQDFMSAVLRGAHDGIVVADRKGDIIMANAAAEQLLGKRSKEIFTGGTKKLFDNAALMRGWWESLGDVAEEVTYRGKPLQVYVSRIRALDRSDLGMALLMRDISGERQLRDEVKRLHFTEPRTGMGNARYLEHALVHHWARARAAGDHLAVVLVGIDNLKEAALSHGSGVEEIIVKSVAQALAETFGKAMPLARTGDDTLAVLVPGLAADAAAALAGGALARIHETPVERIQVWVSCGIGCVQVRSSDGRDELLQAAGRALQEAIEAGSGSVRVQVVDAAP